MTEQPKKQGRDRFVEFSDSLLKMPPQPKEYTITEFQLDQIRSYVDLDFVCQAILSRPVSTPPKGAVPESLCPHFGDIDCCPVKQDCRVRAYCAEHYDHIDKLLIEQRKNDAAIRQAAREEVLKTIFDKCSEKKVSYGKFDVISFHYLELVLMSLRQSMQKKEVPE
jgi:hypothetical protein